MPEPIDKTRRNMLASVCILATIALWITVFLYWALTRKSFDLQKVPALIITYGTIVVVILIPAITHIQKHIEQQTALRSTMEGLVKLLYILMVLIPAWLLYNLPSSSAFCVPGHNELEDLTKEIGDSALPFERGINDDVAGSGYGTLSRQIAGYRSGLIDRMLERKKIDVACRPIYIAALDSVGLDPLIVLYRQLTRLDTISRALNQAIDSHDMAGVEQILQRYGIPQLAPTLKYQNGKPVLMGSLKNYALDIIQGLEQPVELRAAWPPGYPRVSYTYRDLYFLIVNRPQS